MKNCLIIIFIGMMVMIAISAEAAGVGNPETLGERKIATTAEWDYVFHRDLDFIKATRPPGHNNDKPLNFRITGGYNLLGKISYGIFKAMDVFIKLGIANYNLKGDVYVGDFKSVKEKLKAKNAFLYGGGFKLAHELKGGWIVGCDAQYLTSDHELEFRATSMTTGAVTNAKYYNCRIQEWHAAPYIAKKIAAFMLYIGGRYSDLSLSQKNPNDPKRWDNLIFNADYNIGVFTGIDWNLGNSFKLNIEGRFVDETAMSVSGTYIF